MSANALGVVAALIILASFVLRGERNIRLVNMIGCVFLTLWGAKMSPTNYILVLLGAATVLVHCVQIWHSISEARSRRALAKAEGRAADAEGRAADAEARIAQMKSQTDEPHDSAPF